MRTRNRKRRRKDSEEEKLWFLMKNYIENNYERKNKGIFGKASNLPEL